MPEVSRTGLDPGSEVWLISALADETEAYGGGDEREMLIVGEVRVSARR